MNKNIEIETTNKELSHLSGLIFFRDLVSRLNLVNRLESSLPRMERRAKHSCKNKFLVGIFGFIAGADCIDDHNDLRDESLFSQLTDGGLSAATMRNFLGIFKLKHFEKLQSFLPQFAYQLRRKMFPKDTGVIITMDATPHDQYGQQMEGVDWNYQNRWCYSSQNAFDERGFCYGWNLMKGNAHSAVGAVEMIEKIFNNIPKDQPRFFRADSAYGTHKIYNSLIGLNVNFAICLKENAWGPLLERNEYKIKWQRTRISFFDSKKCQIASTIYAPKNLKGRSFLRVVFIRAKKKVITKTDKRHYRYYAIITDLPSKSISDEDVIRFYRQRANAENFIKDLKYGMDFKHFPCRSMNKNKAWGFMGIFAYNLMRFSSFLVSKKGCYLKKVRTKMVYIASEIRKGQRKIKIRFNKFIYKEVKRLEEKIHLKFCSIDLYRPSG